MTSDNHRPPRGYSWPPFQPEHVVSVKSGANARSPRFIEPVIEELRPLVDASPWAKGLPFRSALEAWLVAEARCILFRRFFDEHGLFLDDGSPRPGQTEWDRAESRASTLRAELGLTPVALANLLGKLSAVPPEAVANLEALQQAGAQIRQAAEQRQIAAAQWDTDDADD